MSEIQSLNRAGGSLHLNLWISGPAALPQPEQGSRVGIANRHEISRLLRMTKKYRKLT
jgi:hypothetical protein